MQVPAQPPINIESFTTHVSLTWTAGGVERFIEAIRAADAIPADTTPVVDATNAAGQRRLQLDAVDTHSGATTYVRTEPPAPWTLAWERRTTPVVSLTGQPTTETVRALHVGTTASSDWSAEAVSTLTRLLDA